MALSNRQGIQIVKKLFLAVCAFLVSSAAAVPLAYADQTPGLNGRIAYSTNASPNTIQAIYPSLTNPDPITIASDSGTSYYNPAYSPDGTKIGYTPNYAPPDIFLANADGSNSAKVPVTRFYGTVGWSPNGRTLISAVENNGFVFDIMAFNLDGSNPVQLTNLGHSAYYPHYSPNGAKIVYQDRSNNDIYVMNADGSVITNLTNGAAGLSINSPSWSPDGTKILYLKSNSGTPVINVMNANGSNQTTIPSTAPPAFAVWSPDGTKIAYIDTSNNLHVMTSTGTNDAIYATHAYNGLSWQPLTLGPTAANVNPTVSLNNNAATVDIPSMFSDPYGAGINNSTVTATSMPSHGTTSVNSSTGVITYTYNSVAASHNLLKSIGLMFFPKVSAASATDSFGFRVCSNSGATLCTNGTVTVNLLGVAPDTGAGQPINPAIRAAFYGLLVLSSTMLLAGLRYFRKAHRQ